MTNNFDYDYLVDALMDPVSGVHGSVRAEAVVAIQKMMKRLDKNQKFVIFDENTQLYVGIAEPEMDISFDLFMKIADNMITKFESEHDANLALTLIRKIVKNHDMTMIRFPRFKIIPWEG